MLKRVIGVTADALLYRIWDATAVIAEPCVAICYCLVTGLYSEMYSDVRFSSQSSAEVC
jgi:hypothetical protein